jgi:F0F1-type ATP synthase alpha subunit
MTGFHPHDDEVTVGGREDGMIVLCIRGTQTYREGEYTEERNTTLHVRVSEETAGQIVDDLEAELDDG